MKMKLNRILTSSGAWCSVLTAVGVMALVNAAPAGNMRLNREFNEPGNILISDQFNNRVIEIDPSGKIVWSFGIGPNDFTAKSVIGVNDAQRVGDFTLMAREHWFDVRGYAELNQFPMHLDSMLCYAAHHAGALEQILPEPMRIYHIGHDASGVQPDSTQSMSDRDLVASIAQMRSLHAPVIFNMDNWGLAALTFPETALARTARGSGTGH